MSLWEFPGSLVVRIWHCHCKGLVGKLISDKPHSAAQKKKKILYLFELVFSFSLDIYPGVELLDHIVVLVLATEIFKALNII